LTPYLHGDELRRRLVSNLDAFEPATGPPPAGTVAAVAIALAAKPAGEACFLLTVRSSALRNHSGQYALPGGRADDPETVEEAALRELEEELRPTAAFEVLGRLDAFSTRSGFLMVPLVTWCADPELTLDPNPDEVAAAHFVPLADLDTPGYPAWVEMDGARVIRMAILDGFIHAPTAAILYQFREVALRGRTVRVSEEEEPRFGWW
jgi:8-oxo-dGTP pyrophosphatase MutT (NUDIX family)